MNIITYGVYDSRRNEECVIIGTCREIAAYFDMTMDSLNCTVSRKQKIKKRYEIVKLGRFRNDTDIN